MILATHRESTCRLSICIATFNRSGALRATLERVIAQATDDCEIVVSDNASTDDTEQVVSEYVRRFSCVRYIRQDTNQGFERNFNCAVEAARGTYCWLMPDDDLLKPGAVAAVLKALNSDYSLVVVNAEHTDARDVSKIVNRRRLDFDSDRVYGPDEMDRLFAEIGWHVQYIGCIVIKQSIWLARNRQRYFDSMFMHVGMIFQDRLPGETLVMSDTLVSVSIGKQFWLSRAFELFVFRWPSLVQSLALSESAKRTSSEQSRSLKSLMSFRASGMYCLTEYHRWLRPQLRSKREMFIPVSIALFPGSILNALYVLYYSVINRGSREETLLILRRSRFHFLNLRRGLSRSTSANVDCL